MHARLNFFAATLLSDGLVLLVLRVCDVIAKYLPVLAAILATAQHGDVATRRASLCFELSDDVAQGSHHVFPPLDRLENGYKVAQLCVVLVVKEGLDGDRVLLVFAVGNRRVLSSLRRQSVTSTIMVFLRSRPR